MSNFWFARTGHIVANHLTGIDPASVVSVDEAGQVSGRSVVVRKLKPLPVEAIVRGYIVGSGWKEYKKSGTVCGMALPTGLREADKLPEPIFTPSTKADVGDHDINISFERMVELVGAELAAQVRDVSLKLYTYAAEYALTKGIIIADTKFEFGLDEQGELVLMDEILTPDSSRFWPVDSYAPGANPPSYDKQYVRDYLESLDWNKTPPAPALPDEVVQKTVERYREALRRLTGADIE
jgi:phosphoribosylaminoimidazole-succinocarboxamide synthase